MSENPDSSRRGFVSTLLGAIGGAVAFGIACGEKVKSSAGHTTPGPEAEGEAPAPEPEAPQGDPPKSPEPDSRPEARMTDEEWDKEVEELLKHYQVVHEQPTRSRRRPSEFRCTGAGHISDCDEKLSNCSDSVLCRTAVSGGCKTANACGLHNFGACPNRVICRQTVSSKP